MKRALLFVLVVLVSPTAHAGPSTIDLGGRLTSDFIGIYEKGRAIWVEAFGKAEALLKKLEKAIGGDMEEHERQCFLQEAVRHLIPDVKDGTTFTGAPRGDVTPEFLKHVMEKLGQVNRCSPTNRGYLAFHAWRNSGFQEPKQLPADTKEKRLLQFIQGVAALGAGAQTAPAATVPAGMMPVLNPEIFMPKQRAPGEGM